MLGTRFLALAAAVCVFVLTFFSVREARADTCTWKSTASSSWAVSANWSCAHPPQNQDDLVFPAGAGLQYATTNDVGSFTVLHSISFTGGAYTVSGNQTFVTGGGITSTAATGPVLSLPISIGTTDQTITNNGAGTMVIQTNGIASSQYTVTFAGTGNIDVTAPITGILTSGLIKSGAGVLTLGASNTYPGPTTVNAGIVRLTNGGGLGTSNGGTTILGTGRIELANGVAVGEPLTVAGGGTPAVSCSNGGCAWVAPIDLAADATFACPSVTPFTLSGLISGAGKLTLTGRPFFVNGNNTFTGGLVVATTTDATQLLGPAPMGQGTVKVTKGSAIFLVSAGPYANPFVLDGSGASATAATLAVNASQTVLSGTISLAGNVIIDVTSGSSLTLSGAIGGAGASTSLTKRGLSPMTLSGASTYVGGTNVLAGNVFLTVANALPATTALDLSAGTAVALQGHDQTIGSLAGAGNVSLGAATLTVGDATSTTFSGGIGGTGGITLVGAGTKTWTGLPNHSGPTHVNAGTLLLSQTMSPSSPVSVAAGARLALSAGKVGGTLTSTGGIIAPGFAVPRTGETGDVALDAMSKLEAHFDGVADGMHTQHSVDGTVDLGSATLELTFGYAAQPGDSFLLVANDDVDPVIGTFAGLAEGATFTADGVMLGITYAGGTGNDVVLTVKAPAVDAGAHDGGTTTPDAAGSDAGAGADASTSNPEAGAAAGQDASDGPNDDGTSGSTASAGGAGGDDGGCSVAYGAHEHGLLSGIVFALMALAARRTRRTRRARRARRGQS